ncbi:helix-turn-helix transcriptional regulator [Citricoccus nitrophenolicus]|uniref:helix-turn-helix transcriptional regulator n=1 Tax=Citricoccus nitrophenolicus TaxID=863575 RepID=UPI0039B40FEE
MDNRADVREFLMSRRERVTPEAAGLPPGSNRRVPGLRRSEVAVLAGVSVEYYTKLERGQIAGASSSVLEGLARALHLNEVERAHLYDLARTADGIPASGRRRRPANQAVPPRESLQWTLDAITGAIAVVRNEMQDLVAVNRLGRAFYSPVLGSGGRAPNLARFQFLDPAARDFYPEWERFAAMCVANLRMIAGKNPQHRGIQDLVGELSTQSETFRTLWAAHDVRVHGSGVKHFHHPQVGALELAYEETEFTGDEGLALVIYSAQPGSPSAERLQLLGSLAESPAVSSPAETVRP